MEKEGVGLRAQVRSFILENFLYVTGKQVADTTSLMDEQIVDSTGLLELIMFLEETYGIKIEDEELTPQNLDTIENIERFVTAKLAASQATQAAV